MESLIYIRSSGEGFQYIDVASKVNTLITPKRSLAVIVEYQEIFTDAINRPMIQQLRSLISHRRIKELFLFDLLSLFNSRNAICDFMIFCKSRDVVVYSYREPWIAPIFGLLPIQFGPHIKKVLGQVKYLIDETPKVKKVKTGIEIANN